MSKGMTKYAAAVEDAAPSDAAGIDEAPNSTDDDDEIPCTQLPPNRLRFIVPGQTRKTVTTLTLPASVLPGPPAPESPPTSTPEPVQPVPQAQPAPLPPAIPGPSVCGKRKRPTAPLPTEEQQQHLEPQTDLLSKVEKARHIRCPAGWMRISKPPKGAKAKKVPTAPTATAPGPFSSGKKQPPKGAKAKKVPTAPPATAPGPSSSGKKQPPKGAKAKKVPTAPQDHTAPLAPVAWPIYTPFE